MNAHGIKSKARAAHLYFFILTSDLLCFLQFSVQVHAAADVSAPLPMGLPDARVASSTGGLTFATGGDSGSASGVA